MIGVRLPFESVAKHAQILSVLVQQGEDGAFVTRNTPQAGKNRRQQFFQLQARTQLAADGGQALLFLQGAAASLFLQRHRSQQRNA